MTLIAVRILFFCLVPVGLLLLRKGIQWAQKSFGGAVLLEMPVAQNSAPLAIEKTADYTIWQKGRRLGKAPYPMPAPAIYNTQTGTYLPVQKASTAIYQNSGGMGRIPVFAFWATAGQYTVTLAAQPAPSGIASFVSKNLLHKEPHAPELFIEIKEKRPSFYVVLGILVILLGAACLIGGLVLGVNADKLFTLKP